MAGKSISLFGSIAEQAIKSVSKTVINISSQLNTPEIQKSLEGSEKGIKNINNFLKGIHDLINNILDTLKPSELIKLNTLTKILDKVKFNSINKTLDIIASSINSLKIDGRTINAKKKSLDSILSAIKSLQDIIKAATLLSLAAIPASAIIIPGMAVVKLLTKTIMWSLQSIGNMSKTAEKKLKEGRDTILGIGATFALFALTIYTLGEAATDPTLWKGWAAFTALIGAAIGILFIISLPKLRQANREGAITLIGIGATFALFALTIYTLGEAATDPVLLSGWAAFTALIGAAIGVFMLLSSKKVEGNIFKGALALAAIGASFLAFAGVLAIINAIDLTGKIFVNMLALSGIITIAIISYVLLNKVKSQVIQGALALGIIGASMFAFVGVLTILQKINVEGIWPAFGTLAAIIGLGVAVTIAASFVSSNAILGAAALAIVGGAMYLFAVVANSISEKLANVDTVGILKFEGSLALILGAWSILAIPASLAAAASLIVAPAVLVMMGVISSAAKTVGVVDSNIKEDSIENVKTFVSSLSGVITSYAGLSGVIIKAQLKGMFTIAPALKQMAKGIKVTAEAYAEIAKLNVDFDTVSSNIQTMISSTVGTFIEIAKDPEIKNIISDGDLEPMGGLFGLFGMKKRGKSIVSKVIRMSQDIGMAVAGVAAGIRDMANLYVDEYDKNGKVIGKRQLTDADFELAGEGVAKIVTGFAFALRDHYDDISNATKVASDAIEIAKSVSTAISGFGEDINIFATGKIKGPDDKIYTIDFKGAGQNIADLFTTVTNAISESTKGIKNLVRDELPEDMIRIAGSLKDFVAIISDVSKVDNFSSHVDTTMNMFRNIVGTTNDLFKDNRNIADASKGVHDIADGMDSLVGAVNKVDISKVEKVNQLATTLGEFSKGIKYDFEGLADIINKKLVTAIEGLKEVLGETNDTMSKIKESQETVVENTKTISATSTQNNSQNMNSKKLELMMNNVSKSLDRINDILESTGAKVIVKDIDDSVSKKMRR